MYKLGRTKAERQEVFENIVDIYTNKNLSLEDIAQQYEVSKQAISQFLIKRGFAPRKEEDIKKKHYLKKVEDELIKEKINYFKKRRNNHSWIEFTLNNKVRELEKKVEELEFKLKNIQVACIIAKEIGIDKVTDYFDKIIKICEA